MSSIYPSVVVGESGQSAVIEAFPTEFRRRHQVKKGDDFRNDCSGLYWTSISRAVLEISLPWSVVPSVVQRSLPEVVEVAICGPVVVEDAIRGPVVPLRGPVDAICGPEASSSLHISCI